MTLAATTSYALERDENWLYPSDLPKTVVAEGTFSNQGSIDDVDESLITYLKAQALENAVLFCKAPVGDQLSDWEIEKRQLDPVYIEVRVATTVACKPPNGATSLHGDPAKNISKHIDPKMVTDILCYQGLEPVLDPRGFLLRYNHRTTCELYPNETAEHYKIITELEEDDVKIGAKELFDALPVWVDNRSTADDLPLKGLHRKVATLIPYGRKTIVVFGIVKK